MTAAPPPSNGRSNGSGSTLTQIVRTVLIGMPPGMVIIVVLFCGLIWYLDNENANRATAVAQRTDVVAKLLDKCLDDQLHRRSTAPQQ